MTKRIFINHKGFRIYLGTREDSVNAAEKPEKPEKKKAAKKPASSDND